MLIAAVSLAQLLSVAPPDEIPVQRPGQGEPEPEPAPAVNPEPETAPAEQPEPTPAETAPAESAPEPAPSSGIAPLGGGELEPAPATEPAPAPEGGGGAITSWRDAAPAPATDSEFGTAPGNVYQYDDYKPVYKGTGMFIIGGVLLGLAPLKQVVSLPFCDGDQVPNCGSVGWIDRTLLAGGIGMMGGGGWMRGKWAAGEGERDFSDDQIRKRRIAGWTLAGIGFAGAAVDFSFAVACWQGGAGPYTQETSSPFRVRCASGYTALFADLSAGTASAGMGLGLWANAYRDTKTKAAKQAHVTSLAPIVGRGQFGLGMGGRF